MTLGHLPLGHLPCTHRSLYVNHKGFSNLDMNFRLSHYDIGGTNVVGSKLAAINLEARDIAAKHVLRKVVVARIR